MYENIINKNNLLKELDNLGYSKRVEKIALLSRENKGVKEYEGLLISLLEDGAYEGNLALIGAGVTKNINVILLGLKHPMSSVRKKAAGLLARVGSLSHIEGEILSLSKECRITLIRTISSLNRREVAEKIIDFVYERFGAKEALILLPACSHEVVSKWLVDIGYAVVNWKRISELHTDVVSEYFKTSLESAPLRERDNVWWKFAEAMDYFCRLKTDFILECAKSLGPINGVHPALVRQFGILIRINTDDTYKLLTGNNYKYELIKYGVPKGILKNIHYLSNEQCIELAKLIKGNQEHIGRLLRAFPPSKRGNIFESAYEEEERKEYIFSWELLCELPHKLRDKEAKRMCKLREVYESETCLFDTMSYLFIDNAREFFEKHAKSSDVGKRTGALTSLIVSTIISRYGIKETLEFLKCIKNDRDDVKFAVFMQFTESNISIFNDENIKELSGIIDIALLGRDNINIIYIAQYLMFKIMKYNSSNIESRTFKFALRNFVKIFKHSRSIRLMSFDKDFAKGTEEVIFNELYPIILEANKRENYNLVISVAKSFGKRGYKIEKLQNLLREAIKSSDDNIAIEATKLWIASKETRDERIKELLQFDKSFIKVDKVFLHLHLSRQKWLDEFISGSIIKGRFFTGKTIYLVPANNKFNKWLPRQQRDFSLLLEKVALDTERSIYERSNAIKIMGRMPDINSDKIIRFLNNDELAIVEAALYALSLTENPEKVLSILLDNLNGDKAKIAMYAIPKCISKVSLEELIKILKVLLNREYLKITVRKEAIRLLGVYKSDESISILENEFRKVNVHKDVIIAIGHAARQLLDYEKAWSILEEISNSSEIEVARSLILYNPNNLSEKYRKKYLQLIINLSNNKEVIVKNDALKCIRYWASGNEKVVAQIAAKDICNLDETTTWKTAMDTLLEICIDGKINDIIIEIFNNLSSVKISDKWNVRNQRDLPYRQRLLRFTTKLISLQYRTILNVKPLYSGIIECLKEKEALKNILINFYVALIDWNNVNETIQHINMIENVTKKNPYYLNNICLEMQKSLKRNTEYLDIQRVLEIINILRVKESYEFQYMGIYILKIIGEIFLCNVECIECLRLYRNHTNNEIASFALDIWVYKE